MKRFNKFAITLISMATVTLCSGCSNSIPSKWKYDKNDAKNFAVYNAKLKNRDDKTSYELDVDANTFKNSLNKDSIVFFNKSELDENTTENYYSYKEISKYKVNYDSFETNDDGSGFKVTFDGDQAISYGALINKNDVESGNFVFTYTIPFALDSDQDRIQTEFEEKLISVTPGWNDVKTFINIAGYITQMFIGGLTLVPTAFASGLFGYISALGDAFFGGDEPTVQDVLNKLETMDKKLDDISNKIDQNQREIMNEMVAVEAGIDQVLLNQYKADITEFQTEYVLPIENYLAIYKDGTEQALKSYVQKSETVDFYYALNQDNKWEAQSKFVGHIDDFTKCSLTISSFTNATTYLSKHGNIVGDGFAAELIKDINEHVGSMNEYPSGISKEQLVNDVYYTIVDDLNQEFFSDPSRHTEIVTLMTNVKNLANRLAGINTTSAAESYVERLRMMFSFAGEMKETCVSLLAGLRNQLDGYLEIAQEACKFAEVNCKEMGEAYINAALKIKHLGEAEESYDPNYCFLTKSKIYGNYFRSIWNIKYTNLGNHPTFKASFNTAIVQNFDIHYSNPLTFKEVDIQSLGMINQTNHNKINTRFKLLKSVGLTDAKDYLHYLVDTNIMDKTGFENWMDMRDNGWVGSDAHRFLTSFEIKDMDDSNKDVGMTCTCYGNEDSEYYYVGWKGKYGENRKDSEYKYWSGKKALGDFVDAGDCTLLKDRRIACYAQYHESHKLWIDDEIFGFIDNPAGAYYFLLYGNQVA